MKINGVKFAAVEKKFPRVKNLLSTRGNLIFLLWKKNLHSRKTGQLFLLEFCGIEHLL